MNQRLKSQRIILCEINIIFYTHVQKQQTKRSFKTMAQDSVFCTQQTEVNLQAVSNKRKKKRRSYVYAVRHCNSIWIRPFFESMRWYFSLIRLLLTTSERLMSIYPSVSWPQATRYRVLVWISQKMKDQNFWIQNRNFFFIKLIEFWKL